jgi:hypothetical protein
MRRGVEVRITGRPPHNQNQKKGNLVEGVVALRIMLTPARRCTG